MIKEVLELLNSSDWMIGDKDIDIAKGINKFPESFSELKDNIKRKKIAKNGK
jgi:hypothetical protein